MKRLLPLLVALLLALSVAAYAVPQPSKEVYVYDEANVLSRETKGMIIFSNDLLKEDCGAEFAVVVVNTTGGEDISDYAYELFSSWGISCISRSGNLAETLLNCH